jgi:hypothetical protein
MPEDEEHNGPPPAMDEHSNTGLRNDEGMALTFDLTHGRPISVDALKSSSGDNSVSQIIFLGEDANPARRESRGSWWSGITQERLEEWFPVVVGASTNIHGAQYPSPPQFMTFSNNLEEKVLISTV